VNQLIANFPEKRRVTKRVLYFSENGKKCRENKAEKTLTLPKEKCDASHRVTK